MACNHDCFRCPYDDCIDDEITDEEIDAARERDIRIMVGRDIADDKLIQRKLYYTANRERILAYQKDKYQSDPEEAREKARRYYQRHREQEKERIRAYRAEHPEKVAEWNRRRAEKKREERNERRVDSGGAAASNKRGAALHQGKG